MQALEVAAIVREERAAQHVSAGQDGRIRRGSTANFEDGQDIVAKPTQFLDYR
jgi:hypothetical protein